MSKQHPFLITKMKTKKIDKGIAFKQNLGVIRDEFDINKFNRRI